jgi:hypothetical protein
VMDMGKFHIICAFLNAAHGPLTSLPEARAADAKRLVLIPCVKDLKDKVFG